MEEGRNEKGNRSGATLAITRALLSNPPLFQVSSLLPSCMVHTAFLILSFPFSAQVAPWLHSFCRRGSIILRCVFRENRSLVTLDSRANETFAGMPGLARAAQLIFREGEKIDQRTSRLEEEEEEEEGRQRPISQFLTRRASCERLRPCWAPRVRDLRPERNLGGGRPDPKRAIS